MMRVISIAIAQPMNRSRSVETNASMSLATRYAILTIFPENTIER